MLRASHYRSTRPSWRLAPSQQNKLAVRSQLVRAVNNQFGDGSKSIHPLVNAIENEQLYAYEQRIKQSFDAIIPALKRVSSLQHQEDFEVKAQQVAQQQLGFSLPEEWLANAWVDKLDMARLFAWCVFETYRCFHEACLNEPILSPDNQADFQQWLQQCGFHIFDLSPCADGRLAHVIRYVLRLPPNAVRRKSYAGAMFDIQDSLDKWTEVELLRFRESYPNRVDESTRYLKSVIYHYSSVDPKHQGCAAHGSDTVRAAQSGLDQLLNFQKAVQNSYCCGASIDLLLIGLDTDTDAIRLHLPDNQGHLDINRYIDSLAIYQETLSMSSEQGLAYLQQKISSQSMVSGMNKLVKQLLLNNLSQIDYVRGYFSGSYPDIGHAERFIGVGKGFEEVQLRNLTYFAYLETVEESARDLDVGVKIFSKLNVSKGLPIPILIRFDYPGKVPGAYQRAIEHCQRVASAIHSRFDELSQQGLLHTMQMVRDSHAGGSVEVLANSLNPSG